ncbi:AIG1 [Acrasis kona]|uniref:AIG1 n=1 Tax=Acrasis kona TaxID=1008807 RepID=A0AAW2Z4F9_9EUKA
MLYITRFAILALFVGAFVFMLLPRKTTFIGFQGFAGPFKFMTVWNHALQIIVFGYFTLFGREERRYHSYFERLFVLTTATSTVVVTMFWGLVFSGRFKDTDNIPWGLNHIQHTMPIFATFLELYLHEHKYGSLGGDLFDIGAYGIIYGLFMSLCKYINGWWPYPFLEELYLRDWVFMVGGTLAFFLFSHLIWRGVHSLRHVAKKIKQ